MHGSYGLFLACGLKGLWAESKATGYLTLTQPNHSVFPRSHISIHNCHECFPMRKNSTDFPFPGLTSCIWCLKDCRVCKVRVSIIYWEPLEKPSVHTSRNGSYMLRYYMLLQHPTYHTNIYHRSTDYTTAVLIPSLSCFATSSLSKMSFGRPPASMDPRGESMGLHKVGCNHNHYTRYTSGIPSGNLT